MPRFVRHFLFASLIACHAAVMLCGPCLHALPGSSHQFGPATKTHRPDAPAQSSRDSADNCLICHFVAQGQLTVDSTCERSAPLVTEIEVPELPTSRPLPASCPLEPTRSPRGSCAIGVTPASVPIECRTAVRPAPPSEGCRAPGRCPGSPSTAN